MKIEYDTKLQGYTTTINGETAHANTRMMLIRLACGTVWDDREDGEDVPEVEESEAEVY